MGLVSISRHFRFLIRAGPLQLRSINLSPTTARSLRSNIIESHPNCTYDGSEPTHQLRSTHLHEDGSTHINNESNTVPCLYSRVIKQRNTADLTDQLFIRFEKLYIQNKQGEEDSNDEWTPEDVSDAERDDDFVPLALPRRLDEMSCCSHKLMPFDVRHVT
eukprot:GHVN01057281.1.p1 GENE.GHVN01057281.1~~GHVN01057281.1.p1  ORF type:complete len:161 (-),score=17.40 GHVN01057281.1:527-1009(-)